MPPRNDFAPLPKPRTACGAPRRVGVEIEFGGLTEARAAQVCLDRLGGRLVQGDGSAWQIEGSRIGGIDIYLDTALRKATQSTLRDLALDLGREVVPVEIVTEPLDMGGLARLEELREALRRAGALGSRAGWLFGFGVHLNVEIASARDADVVRPLLAYALIEDWLRAADPIDESRRLLPFTDPYPTDFTRALATAGPSAELNEAILLYLEHTPSRNRGLDMLPVFAHLAPEQTGAALTSATSARPAFHFRLPDCRIDDPAWSLAREWQRWVTVEHVADDVALLDRLADAWLEGHGPITLIRAHWARECGAILRASGLDRVATRTREPGAHGTQISGGAGADG